jgi:hypothetical protein
MEEIYNIPKPQLELKVLRNTEVEISNVQDWNSLMKVYEFGNWKMGRIKEENSPILLLDKLPYKTTYISSGTSRKFLINGINTQGQFPSKGYSILSLKKFYEIQRITRNDLLHIDFYLEDQERIEVLERM